LKVDINALPNFNPKEWLNVLHKQGVHLIDNSPVVLSDEDIRHLEWTHSRMVFIHKENPQYDYMLKFEKIIKRLKNDSI
jgi:hypothetical protein